MTDSSADRVAKDLRFLDAAHEGKVVARVSVKFVARQSGALGIVSDFNRRRTIYLWPAFSEEEAVEAARRELYEPDAETGEAFERVSQVHVAFN